MPSRNETGFLQGFLGSIGPAFSGGVQSYYSAKDRAAELAAQAEDRKWNRAQQEKVLGLHENQARTQALGHIRQAIKEGTVTPYEEQLIKLHGFKTDDYAPTVNAGLDAEMGPGFGEERAALEGDAARVPAPQQMTNYSQDKTAGVRIPESLPGVQSPGSKYPPTDPNARTVIGTMSYGKKLDAGEAKNAASSYLGKLPETLSPVEQGLAKEGMAAQFDRDLSQQEVLQDRPIFEASAKQPWDTYNRESIVAQAPQNVEMDTYSTSTVDKPNLGQMSSVTKPNEITAPISKPTPNVKMPSPLMTTQENYQQRLAAEKAAEQRNKLAIEDKRGGYKKDAAGIRAKATEYAADVGGKSRVSAASIEPSRKKQSEKDHWKRVKEYGVTHAIWQKDANGDELVGTVDEAKADALRAKDAKVQQGVAQKVSQQDKATLNAKQKNLDAADRELKTANNLLTDPYYESRKEARDARITRAQTAYETALKARDAELERIAAGGGSSGAALPPDEQAVLDKMSPQDRAEWEALQ